MFHTVSVIGGDLRQLTLGRELKKEGYHVFLHGFDKYADDTGLDEEEELDFVLCSDIVVLPVPVTFDGHTINSPYAASPLSIDDFLDGINPSALLFGGQIKPNLQKALTEKNIKFCDYLTREELAIRNAVPTAEGAIKIAIEETPITLHGSKCLVLGYGRIGKILSRMLQGLGANVWVEARKYADLAMIEGHGYEPVSLGEVKHCIDEFDIIFNTIPALILDETLLKAVKQDALIIDLSSKPGGVEFFTDHILKLKCILICVASHISIFFISSEIVFESTYSKSRNLSSMLPVLNKSILSELMLSAILCLSIYFFAWVQS